ncbi:gamma-glutamyltransferase, putative [Ixodes scapularis]|uniref:Gamma-glutamyltransferase, putative n=1 Tax=Ixodes scapularis TaxID=6945 RepID=B7QFB1_IXOSC|nr:gamma-glutamyltransferase, putative [Ixodes scapularis]|eukprot:XP_002414225.1 gamma-glutamyltransferase, putative [Ixodes scapularis]
MRALNALLKVTRSRIPWSGLFDEAIKLAEDGFVVSEHLAAAIHRNKDILTKEPFRSIYTNAEGEYLKAGDTLRQRTLAQTLRDMAKSAEQGDFFYNGKMARDMVADIRQEGSLMTEDDVAAYTVRTVTPLRFPLGNGHVLWTPRPPAGGALVGIVLGVIWFNCR